MRKAALLGGVKSGCCTYRPQQSHCLGECAWRRELLPRRFTCPSRKAPLAARCNLQRCNASKCAVLANTLRPTPNCNTQTCRVSLVLATSRMVKPPMRPSWGSTGQVAGSQHHSALKRLGRGDQARQAASRRLAGGVDRFPRHSKQSCCGTCVLVRGSGRLAQPCCYKDHSVAHDRARAGAFAAPIKRGQMNPPAFASRLV